MSEYRLIMSAVIALCALAVVCSVNPGLAQLVSTVFIVVAVAGALGLVAFVVWFIHAAMTDLPDDELDYSAELEREAVR